MNEVSLPSRLRVSLPIHGGRGKLIMFPTSTRLRFDGGLAYAKTHDKRLLVRYRFCRPGGRPVTQPVRPRPFAARVRRLEALDKFGNGPRTRDSEITKVSNLGGVVSCWRVQSTNERDATNAVKDVKRGICEQSTLMRVLSRSTTLKEECTDRTPAKSTFPERNLVMKRKEQGRIHKKEHPTGGVPQNEVMEER